MSKTARNKTNNTSSPSWIASAASTNLTKVIFNNLKQLIEEKFETIEDHLCWKAYKGSIPRTLNLIKETDKLATVASELAHSNTELITDNSEKISKQDFQTEEMSN